MVLVSLIDVLRSRAKAAIGFSYAEGEGDESGGEGQTDEDILTAFLAEQETDKEKAFSSESEYGEEGCHHTHAHTHSHTNALTHTSTHTHTHTHIHTEIDMDVDSFSSGQVDRLNVLALNYDIPAGAFSKQVQFYTQLFFVLSYSNYLSHQLSPR